MQVDVRRQALAQLLGASTPDSAPFLEWLDVEGSSLIRTLGKAWGDDISLNLSRLFEGLVLRHVNPTTDSEAGSAATQTCALAMAYILPTLLKYTPTPFLTISIHSHACVVDCTNNKAAFVNIRSVSCTASLGILRVYCTVTHANSAGSDCLQVLECK